MAKINSTKINIYPSAYRGKDGETDSAKVFDPESRLYTEQNIIRPILLEKNYVFSASGEGTSPVSPRGSYVISSTVDDSGFEFVIYGYYFKIKNIVTDILDQIESSNGTNFYACIELKDKNTNLTDTNANTAFAGTSLSPLDSNNQDTLDIKVDSSYEFKGLDISLVAGVEDLTAVGKHYLLIATKTGNSSYTVPVTSRIKIDTKTVHGGNNRALDDFLKTNEIELNSSLHGDKAYLDTSEGSFEIETIYSKELTNHENENLEIDVVDADLSIKATKTGEEDLGKIDIEADGGINIKSNGGSINLQATEGEAAYNYIFAEDLTEPVSRNPNIICSREFLADGDKDHIKVGTQSSKYITLKGYEITANKELAIKSSDGDLVLDAPWSKLIKTHSIIELLDHSNYDNTTSLWKITATDDDKPILNIDAQGLRGSQLNLTVSTIEAENTSMHLDELNVEGDVTASAVNASTVNANTGNITRVYAYGVFPTSEESVLGNSDAYFDHGYISTVHSNSILPVGTTDQVGLYSKRFNKVCSNVFNEQVIYCSSATSSQYKAISLNKPLESGDQIKVYFLYSSASSSTPSGSLYLRCSYSDGSTTKDVPIVGQGFLTAPKIYWTSSSLVTFTYYNNYFYLDSVVPYSSKAGSLVDSNNNSYNLGNIYKPVYFNNGVPAACNFEIKSGTFAVNAAAYDKAAIGYCGKGDIEGKPESSWTGYGSETWINFTYILIGGILKISMRCDYSDMWPEDRVNRFRLNFLIHMSIGTAYTFDNTNNGWARFSAVAIAQRTNIDGLGITYATFATFNRDLNDGYIYIARDETGNGTTRGCMAEITIPVRAA